MASTPPNPNRQSHIRPVDTNRDLAAIADLIEICFAPTMDEDGRDYIRHIRRAAEDPTLRRWASGPNERVSLPISGYVWEDFGHVIGNMSLIPFYRQGRWRTMIANVAVHPDYRRCGIARALTVKGIEHIQEHDVKEAWLQVRDDNPPALALYQSLGFKERCRRTTWELPRNQISTPSLALVDVSKRHPRDWSIHREWLERIYPPEVAWNLDLDINRLRPSPTLWLSRWLDSHTLNHWCARKLGDTLGFVTWEAPAHAQGSIWLAPNPQLEHESLLALLSITGQYIPTRRPISINYPAGQATGAFTQAGFSWLNTLIWMSLDL